MFTLIYYELWPYNIAITFGRKMILFNSKNDFSLGKKIPAIQRQVPIKIMGNVLRKMFLRFFLLHSKFQHFLKVYAPFP